MRIHRFFVAEISEDPEIAVSRKDLLSQWQNVLRFKPGHKLVLFNGQGKEVEYELLDINKNLANLKISKMHSSRIPKRKLYIFWSLLKKDKNEFILQKCTEMGVSGFVPVLSERTIKRSFNLDRSRAILIEAAEQCGRGDIPVLYDPITLDQSIAKFGGKFELAVCEQNGEKVSEISEKELGLFIGPEGGWSDFEQKMFSKKDLKTVGLGDFTLRSETAAVVASAKFLP